MTKKENKLVIIVDTREQKPYVFKDHRVVFKALKTGDYSVEGYEHYFAIERKSFPDFIHSITVDRRRFEEEIRRGRRMRFFCIVVEFDCRNCWSSFTESKIAKKAIINTALLWSFKHGVPVYFAGNRTQGKYVVKTLCEACVKYWPAPKEMEQPTQLPTAEEMDGGVAKPIKLPKGLLKNCVPPKIELGNIENGKKTLEEEKNERKT